MGENITFREFSTMSDESKADLLHSEVPESPGSTFAAEVHDEASRWPHGSLNTPHAMIYSPPYHASAGDDNPPPAYTPSYSGNYPVPDESGIAGTGLSPANHPKLRWLRKRPFSRIVGIVSIVFGLTFALVFSLQEGHKGHDSGSSTADQQPSTSAHAGQVQVRRRNL